MKRLIDTRHTDGHKNKTKKSKNKTKLSLFNAGPQNRVSISFTKCGGCHPKGLIVASSYKIKQIIIAPNNVPVLILLFARQEKNQLKLYLFPLVSPNFWN